MGLKQTETAQISTNEWFAVLPYPITVNKCWKAVKSGIKLNPIVKKYRKDVYYIIYGLKLKQFGEQKVKIRIDLHPPDKKKRDIDNILKCLLDALQYARVIDDDFHVCELMISRKEIVKNGQVCVSIISLHNTPS